MLILTHSNGHKKQYWERLIIHQKCTDHKTYYDIEHKHNKWTLLNRYKYSIDFIYFFNIHRNFYWTLLEMVSLNVIQFDNA